MGSKLSRVSRGKLKTPITAIIYGIEGVGKTTFAADWPKPIFLEPEGGSARLNVDRLSEINTWDDALAVVDELTTDQHSYKTLVIDSADWLERMMHDKLCRANGVSVIQQVQGGYGKGETAAMLEWDRMIHKLKLLRDKREMNIVITGHAEVKTFADPEAPAPYDRFQLKIEKKSAALLREFVDVLLFARFETLVTKEKGEKKGRAMGDGKRVMYTEHRPAFDAKNRYNLPFELPVSFSELIRHIDKEQDPAELIAEINSIEVPEEKKAAMKDAVAKAGSDVSQLLKIRNYARALVA